MEGVDDELLRYRGQWDVQPPRMVSIKDDKGLALLSPAAHHAISAKFSTPLDPTGKPLVVQYEVNFQDGLECGGAYLKLLSEDAEFSPENFSDKSPYVVMFGPDKCGGTNKVHFIFRHMNPVTKQFEEKHMSLQVGAEVEKKTILYTLIIRPDNSFEVLVNNDSKKKGSLLEDVSPPVNPPKEIDDATDKKPADWVDQAKISDPEAKKPHDWDETATREILDEGAKMPSDWLENEENQIPDPEAVKPEDWDAEEDGDWAAPTVDNPACEKVSGCGTWVRPTKKNPAYKGIWKAPIIDNPAYKGVWAPRKIANPDYFEDLHPANLNKIGAIGFELWTMQANMIFDNIYIGHSEEDAKKLADKTWAVKHEIEKQIEKESAPKDEPKRDTGLLGKYEKIKDATLELFKVIQSEIEFFVTRAKQSPVDAVKEFPHVAGGFLSTILLPLLISFLFGGPAAPKKRKVVNKKKKSDKKTKSGENEGETKETTEDDNKDAVITADSTAEKSSKAEDEQ